MNIIAVDDEKLVLEDIKDICEGFDFVTSISTFSNPADALEYTVLNTVDAAFLDIEMPVMSGLELAKRFNRIRPEMKIIFVTGFKEYAYEAFGVNAVGYILKPFSDDMILEQLNKIRTNIPHRYGPKVFVKTFGYFDVFVDGKPIHFSSSKSKELLALLVDRRGGSVSTENAVSALWPDRSYDESVQSLFRKVLKSLRTALSDAGVLDILIDARNQRSVDTSKFDCDCYDLFKNDEKALKEYQSEYMNGYAWAKQTKQHIDNLLGRN